MDLIEIDITENLTTVEVNVQEGSIVTSGTGEANTTSNEGGFYELALPKDGVNLPFRTISAGDYISIGSGTDSLSIKVEGYPNLFIAETDTPGSYAGASLKTLRVNFDEDAIEFYTPSVADSDNIQDAAGTTGMFTEETADRLVGHSANTGTDLIFEMFEGTGTPVSVFQVDGNGNLFNNGNYQLVINSTTNLMLGTSSTHASLSGATHNTFIGYTVGNAIIGGDRNTVIGSLAGDSIANGTDNVVMGYNSGGQNSGGDYNVCIGSNAGGKLLANNNTIIGGVAGQNLGNTSGCIFLGYQAGKRQTTAGNTLLINNYAIANAATELTDSIIYGLMDATKANQTLTFNAVTKVSSTAAGNPFVVDVSGTEVFQVNPAGILSNNGVEYYQYRATNTHIFGNGGILTGTGNNNIIIGQLAGNSYTTGYSNNLMGTQSGYLLGQGIGNLALGHQSGYSIVSGDYNVLLGIQSGYIIGQGGAANERNIFLGAYSGRYQLGVSNKLLIANQNYSNAANELTNSIIYGVMAAAPANQDLTFNANVFLSQIKSGATQVASGAAANEIWKTASHATLPDNVLMIGV